jgi:hypothetical protein
VRKLEVPHVYVDIFLEYRNVTFFENIFPLKKLYCMSRLLENVIADTTLEPSKNFVHIENIHLNQSMRKLIGKLLGGARDKELQSLFVMISLFILWMTLQEPFQMHLHL